MEPDKLKHIVEAALLAAARPLSLDQLLSLFEDNEKPEKADLREALKTLADEFADRSVALKEVASGWRIQVRTEYAQWTSRLWEERPTRYSRALLETLALVAYRQPITRGEIEDVRGVSVSTNIIKTMLDRNWIRIVGHRDVPGRPAMFGTTRDFLDYFGLKSLDELPTLAELRDIDSINVELDFDGPQVASADAQADDRIDDQAGDNAEPDTLPQEAANHDTQENTDAPEDSSTQDRGQNRHTDDENETLEDANDSEEAAHFEEDTDEGETPSRVEEEPVGESPAKND